MGTVPVEIYSVVFRHSNRSLLVCLHLRLGSKQGEACELQHKEREGKRERLSLMDSLARHNMGRLNLLTLLIFFICFLIVVKYT